MKKLENLLVLFTLSTVLVLGFQNCGEFAMKNTDQSSMDSQNQVATSALDNDDIGKSILISNNSVLDKVNEDFDMGYLLGQVGKMENAANVNATRTAGRWVAQIFELAQNQQDDYVARGQLQLGQAPNSDRYMKRVLQRWTDKDCKLIHRNDNNFRAIKQIDDPEKLKSKTFRLLAVANRMDLAGEYDDRLTNLATSTPRFLGEVHLIYNLIDRTSNYENSNCSDGDKATGKAYPMAFVVSFRLPVIKRQGTGNFPFRLSSTPSLYSLGENEANWKSQMKLWAQAWQTLKNTSNSTAHANLLKRVLSLAARPENFLSLKSNTDIANKVYELREWYIFRSGSVVGNPDNANGLLIPRKLRREPYKCLNNSHAVTKTLEHYWKDRVNDLDMTTRRYNLDDPDDPVLGALRGNSYDHLRAGYAIMRDHTRTLIDDLDLLKIRGSGANKNYYWSDRCGTTTTAMPFGMHTGPARNDPPTGDIDEDTLMMLAPFGRIRGSGPIWEVRKASLPSDWSDSKIESMRHAFAVRTCTGCHSQEGATRGFHIEPRLAGENGKLSKHLTGGGEFSYAGATYKYNVLNKRKNWFNQFLSKQKSLYNTLKLPERNN